MKTLVSNFYMIDLLLWLSLLAGINAQCENDAVVLSGNGQTGHIEYVFVDPSTDYVLDLTADFG